jgi:hypothetical protein
MWTRAVQYLFTNKVVNVLYSIYKLYIVHEYVLGFKMKKNSVNYKIEVLCAKYLPLGKWQKNHW